MAVAIQANSPLAEQLSNIVQPKLVDMGWTTGGFDDSALTEYIILMLVNGKTQEQIATELSNDLLNLGPEDSGASTFAGWLFDQVNMLVANANGSLPTATESFRTPPQPIPATATIHADNTQHGDASAQDAEMGEAMDGIQGSM